MVERNRGRSARDYDTAVGCAEAFHRVGGSLMTGIPARLPEGSSRKIPPAMGDLAVCATNLAFAAELYLKAAHMKLGRTPPVGHDLWKLFAGLPKPFRLSVERRYVRLFNSLPLPLLGSITVARGPEASPDWKAESPRDYSLERMLKRSRAAFESWRYLFEVEIHVSQTYEFHTIDYLPLHLVCEALRSELTGAGPTPDSGASGKDLEGDSRL